VKGVLVKLRFWRHADKPVARDPAQRAQGTTRPGGGRLAEYAPNTSSDYSSPYDSGNGGLPGGATSRP